MNVIEAVILGLIQGLTEFIPISSSGHLVIAQYFLNGASDHLFLEWINVGTVLALIIYFWARLRQIANDILANKNYRLARNIIITALPAGLIGFIFADFIAGDPFFGSVWVVVFTLLLLGIVMVVLERLPKKSSVTTAEKLGQGRALIIGLAQALALVPGVSRSGSTIIAGRLMGLKAATAAEYSFLVSIPIMLGVIAKLLARESDRAYLYTNWDVLLIGNVFALLAGIVAVGFLMRYLAKNSLALFGWYRIVLAGVLAVVLLLQ